MPKIDIKNERTQQIAAAFFGILLGALSALAILTLSNLPQVEQLQNYEPQGITLLKDRTGQVVYEFYREKRIPVRFEEIPPLTKKAFLVTEDWNFYQHPGIDVIGIARAMIVNIVRGSFVQGASTITQQLSRVLFLSPEKTLTRKLKEVILTLRIENRFTKDEIFHLYLNQIYLGEGTYGIEAAAQKYFGTSIQNTTIAQNALLAALPKGPSVYSPFKNAQKAMKRRNNILALMYEKNIITQEQFEAAVKDPIPTEPAVKDAKQNYFTFHILQELSETINIEQVYRGKIQIQSTLDAGLQMAAEEAVKKGVENYIQRHSKKPKGKNKTKDLIPPEKIPQVSVLAMDVHSGEVRALVGGRSFGETQFNRALQAIRQPGSSFKPFLYAYALENGYTQSTHVLDAPLQFNNSASGRWSPGNYDKEYDGYIPTRIALEKSKNTPTIRILENLGVGSFLKWMTRFQLSTKLANDLTIALGSSSMNLMELTRSYAIFANGGLWVEPVFVTSVLDENGNEMWDRPIRSDTRIMEEATASLIKDMLRGVVQSGTARFASDLSCETAGKTGTTDNYVDALLVGFSSEIVVMVWVGFDDRTPLGHGESGSVAAGRIWKEVMDHHCKSDEPGELQFSSALTWVDVDHETGLLPNEMSVDIQRQAYLPGTEPDTDCCVEQYDVPTQ